jgi:hypothetical protein
MRFVMAMTLALASLALAGDRGFGLLVNSDGSIGGTFNLDQPVKTWNFGPDSLNSRSIRYSTDAVFGSKIESLPNHLYAGLSGALELFDLSSNMVFDADLNGVRLEATQDRRTVDLAFGADVGLMHSSLLNHLANWLNPGSVQGANPSEVTLGWSYLAHAKTDTLGPGWNNRLDAGLFLSLPVTRDLDLAADLKAFNQVQNAFTLSTWRTMMTGVVTFRVGDKWAHVEYQKGGIPPRFDPVDKWDIGFGLAFQ